MHVHLDVVISNVRRRHQSEWGSDWCTQLKSIDNDFAMLIVSIRSERMVNPTDNHLWNGMDDARESIDSTPTSTMRNTPLLNIAAILCMNPHKRPFNAEPRESTSAASRDVLKIPFEIAMFDRTFHNLITAVRQNRWKTSTHVLISNFVHGSVNV